jgi:hypothetical protein
MRDLSEVQVLRHQTAKMNLFVWIFVFIGLGTETIDLWMHDAIPTHRLDRAMVPLALSSVEGGGGCRDAHVVLCAIDILNVCPGSEG